MRGFANSLTILRRSTIPYVVKIHLSKCICCRVFEKCNTFQTYSSWSFQYLIWLIEVTLRQYLLEIKNHAKNKRCGVHNQFFFAIRPAYWRVDASNFSVTVSSFEIKYEEWSIKINEHQPVCFQKYDEHLVFLE